MSGLVVRQVVVVGVVFCWNFAVSCDYAAVVVWGCTVVAVVAVASYAVWAWGVGCERGF